jgi:RNA polymerase sigma-70 factor (ECF subfamily)
MHNQITVEELNILIEKAKNGDVRAFEVIVRAYQRYGLAVSFRILCSEDDAKDIVQESFIRI